MISESMNEGDEGAHFSELFETDLELSFVSCKTSSQMRLKRLFKEAYAKYVFGQWNDCQEKLNEIINEYPLDGPSIQIKKFIQSHHDMQPPAYWMGYRRVDH